MDKLVKKILVEWSYRVDDGMINTESYTHLGILREILSELDLPTDFIMEFMGNLTEEQTFKARSKETDKIVYYKSKENMEKAIKAGTAIPLDKETSDKPEKVKGQDMFAKDLEKEKEEKKFDEKAVDDKSNILLKEKDKELNQDIDFDENPPESVVAEIEPTDEEFEAKKKRGIIK